MAIDTSEVVLHESHGTVITTNEDGDELTIWKLTDTRLLRPGDEKNLEAALRSEISLTERTGIVVEETGYTKVYRPHMIVIVLTDVQETVERILKEMVA